MSAIGGCRSCVCEEGAGLLHAGHNVFQPVAAAPSEDMEKIFKKRAKHR